MPVSTTVALVLALAAAWGGVPGSRAQEVNLVYPTFSPLAGGTDVTILIAGFNASAPVNVLLAGIPCLEPVLANNIIHCFSGPAPSPTSGPAVVTIADESAESESLFSYEVAPPIDRGRRPVPVVLSVDPTGGPRSGGATVLVHGTDFGDRAGDLVYAQLASVNCTAVQYINDTDLACTSGPSETTGSGPVIVCTTSRGCSLPGAVLYTYNAPPTVLAIEPTYCHASGLVPVNITGMFTMDGEVVSVTLNGVDCDSFVRVSATLITCITGSVLSSSAGTGPVLVTTTTGGTSNANVTFTYLPNPIITTISPTDGPLKGGTPVTISGSSLGTGPDSLLSVSIAGIACASITWVSASEVVCTTGQTDVSDRGPAQVVLVTGGTANSIVQFYYRLPPFIETIVPNNGPITGDTFVVITGEELGLNQADIVSVTVAGVPCTNVTHVSVSVVNCVTAPSSVPVQGVVLISTRSSGDIEDESQTVLYQYNQPPTTQLASPSTGPETGGIPISIFGQSLGQAESDVVDVVIAGTSCRETLVYLNSTCLQCTLPPKPPVVSSNLVVVSTVSGGSGLATAGAVFDYTPTPVVTGIYPAQGTTSGYTIVRITGTGFGSSAADVVDVVIAGVSCRFSLVYESPTSLSCFTGSAGEQRTGNITVTTTAGGEGRSAVDYSYIPGRMVGPTVARSLACYQASSASACPSPSCYWCANTATCLSDQVSCPIECTAGLVSCSGLILILLQVVLIGVVTAGFFVIIYYVDRDEDLRQYAGARMPLATTDQGDPSADLLGPHV